MNGGGRSRCDAILSAVDVLLKAVGDTPIMRTKKWAVEADPDHPGPRGLYQEVSQADGLRTADRAVCTLGSRVSRETFLGTVYLEERGYRDGVLEKQFRGLESHLK
ncbi:hypothetical protein DUI87_26363 [Hirundo rustica rustica]|uniref:Uncharacterized protein n=1 Tax=Hirundo rustica rustica TaxID=333673 RepID=A0A3M0JA05_HIRRU|nr:hypothetical protein DUI87_26363 [Hirundo rustica rustica]